MGQLVLKESPSPSTPSAGQVGIYIKQGDGNIAFIDDAGTISSLLSNVIEQSTNVIVTANSGTSYNVDLSLSSYFNITLTDNVTFTFSNPASSGITHAFTMKLKQDGTGGRTVIWPVSVKWPEDFSGPTITSTANRIDFYTFITYNGGTSWYGFVSGQNYT